MEASDAVGTEAVTRLATQLVAAYVSNNIVPAADLAGLIHTVCASLRSLGGGGVDASDEQAKPAVPIKKSIMPDYLICLEDGKRLKMLKRHLRSTYGLSPDEYRARWGLGQDYPMVAPNYAAQRSAFAKEIGLGRGARRKSPRDTGKTRTA